MEVAIPRQVRCIYIYEIAEETPLVHVCCVSMWSKQNRVSAEVQKLFKNVP
jgi:hypothetical protein